jgi:N-acetylmuramoyl-L-alanine amidase
VRYFGLAILLLASSVAAAAPVEVQGVRLWAAPDNTRVVFDISAPVQHSVFTLSNPDRLVLDLAGARWTRPLPALDYGRGALEGIRWAPRNGRDLRVVLDLRDAVQPRTFVLQPNAPYGHRLVIDLMHAPDATPPVRAAAASAGGAPQSAKPSARQAQPALAGLRDIVIAIDPGHGGEDPGAIGARGTREKDVVLAISRRLASLVNAERGMRAVLIRDGDYYVGLRQRIQRAREARADLFVSVHADAFKDRRAGGSSVYTLSTRGASTEAARWLAERENAADLVGGVSLDDKDDLLASVLLDLSQAGTNEASLAAANQVLAQLQRVGRVHKPQVEQAGFVVLKSPEIPSILVETAFITNPNEEARLRDPQYQQAIAEAIMAGIRAYYRKYPPQGTMYAAREHIISRGDTLSGIAARYSVSLDRLRTTNGLNGDLLRVGDVLRIPDS